MYGRFGDDEEQGGGRAFVSQQQHADDVLDARQWQDAYANSGSGGTSSPPMVAVSDSSGGFSWDTLFGRGKQVVTGLVDIFGRPMAPAGQPVVRDAGMPLWGWVAIGVGGVVVLGVAARSLRRPSMAGHRRHRRSRR